MQPISLTITLTESQSTLTKIITTLRKLQFDIKLLHLEKENESQESYIDTELEGSGSQILLEKSLKRIEGVHDVCNTTQ